MLRRALALMRRHGVDVQSTHRRDSYDWLTVTRRLCAGRDVRIVVDIGAHWGQMCRAYHGAFPAARVYAFEPTPSTFARLRENLGAEPWAELVNAAVGDHDGETQFFLSTRNSEMSNSAFPFEGGESEEVRAKLVRLDTFCQEKSIEHIDCLKIDVEGFEIPVLEGARGLLERQAVDVIMAEGRTEPLCPGAASLTTLSMFLDPLGYNLFGLYTLQWFPNHQLQWFDTIWVSNKVFRRYMGREPRRAVPAASASPAC